jgi:hypothetical protein
VIAAMRTYWQRFMYWHKAMTDSLPFAANVMRAAMDVANAQINVPRAKKCGNDMAVMLGNGEA